MLWKKSKQLFVLVIVLTHCEIKIHLVKYSDIYVDIGILKSTDKTIPSLKKTKRSKLDYSHYPKPGCEDESIILL